MNFWWSQLCARVIFCHISDMKFNWSRNFLIDVNDVDSEMLTLNCQSRLFQTMISWLCTDFMLIVFVDRKICCAKVRKSFSNRASVMMYLTFCKIDNVENVLFLNRFISAWYHETRFVWRKRFFFISKSSVKCQIRTASRKHWDKIVRSLSSSRIVIMSLSRFTKTYMFL